MNFHQFKEELSNKNLDELKEIQQESLLTIRPTLVALSKNTSIEVNKSFFLFCMACVGCDQIVSENEYQLIKKFINVQVTIKEVQEYVNELINHGKLLDFAFELTKAISNISSEGKEELVRFASCFIFADEINKEKEEFINSLIDVH